MHAGARAPGGVVRSARLAESRLGGGGNGHRAVKAAGGADGAVVRIAPRGQGLSPGLALDAGGAVAGGAADDDPRLGHLFEGPAVDPADGIAAAEPGPGAHGEVHHIGPQVPGILQRPEDDGVVGAAPGAVGEYLHAEDLGRRCRPPEGDAPHPVPHVARGQGGDVGPVVVGGGHVVVPAVVVVGEGDALGDIAPLGAPLLGKFRHVLPAEGRGLHQGPIGEGLVAGVQAAVQDGDDRPVPGIALLPEAVRLHELQALLRGEGLAVPGGGSGLVGLGQAHAGYARQLLQGGQRPGLRLHGGAPEQGLVTAEERYALRLLQGPGHLLRTGAVLVEDHGPQGAVRLPRPRRRGSHVREQQQGRQE